MSADTAPNTKQVAVPFDVPRDPAAYRATTHFQQRLKERVPETAHDDLVRDLITSGHVEGASDPAAGYDGVFQHFAFSSTVDGAEWRLVVGIVPEAFRSDGRKHLAITIMEVSE